MAEKQMSVTDGLLERIRNGTFRPGELDGAQAQEEADDLERAIKDTAGNLNLLFAHAAKLKIQPVLSLEKGAGFTPQLCIHLQRRIV